MVKRLWVLTALVCLAGVGALTGRPATEQQQPCRLSTFTVTFSEADITEATGDNTLALRLRNTGREPCVLYGFPRIALFDGQGKIPFRISHTGDQMVTARRPTRILVRPRRAAFVLVDKYRCDRGDLRPARTLRLGFVAGRSVGIRMQTRSYAWCGPGDPGSWLTVSPYEPSIRAALRHH